MDPVSGAPASLARKGRHPTDLAIVISRFAGVRSRTESSNSSNRSMPEAARVLTGSIDRSRERKPSTVCEESRAVPTVRDESILVGTSACGSFVHASILGSLLAGLWRGREVEQDFSNATLIAIKPYALVALCGFANCTL
jgi:hypothetical protein